MKQKHFYCCFLFLLTIILISLPLSAAFAQNSDNRKRPIEYSNSGGIGRAMPGTGRIGDKLGRELRDKLAEKKLPRGVLHLIRQRSGNFDTALIDDPNGLALLQFHAPYNLGYSYVAWNRSMTPSPQNVLKGSYWCIDTNGETYYRNSRNLYISQDIVLLIQCAPPSPVIESIYLDGDPIQPFRSSGDLWMTTWADDDCLYSGWGDGYGVERRNVLDRRRIENSDCGIAKFSGKLPNIRAEERCYLAPTIEPDVNDKPSSLLFIDGLLYGHFHSPLGDPWIGYAAYSDDYGATWKRSGFWREWETPGENASPWTADRNSRFRCMFFINMGRNYELNEDGYVYSLAIGSEYDWAGGVCLARVPKNQILIYSSYEYFTGLVNNEPQWSISQFNANPILGVHSIEQGSVMYHPYLKRYLFLTTKDLYDAPDPWGPWTFAGRWKDNLAMEAWKGGYQPGIISKDTGPDYFWFTISGSEESSQLGYCVNLGKIILKIKD